MKKWIVLSAAVCCAGASPAQYTPHPAMATEFGFVSPVAFSMLLSANYGELRGNHFHSGIDIKTQGVINKPDPCDRRRHGRPHRRQSVRIRQGPVHKPSERYDERLRSPGTFFGLDRAVYP